MNIIISPELKTNIIGYILCRGDSAEFLSAVSGIQSEDEGESENDNAEDYVKKVSRVDVTLLSWRCVCAIVGCFDVTFLHPA